MKKVKYQSEFLFNISKLIQYAYERGYVFTAGEMYRTTAQQALYLEQGRTKTMDSMHLERMAFDMNFFYPNGDMVESGADYIRPIGEFWKKLNSLHRWGGDFETLKDYGHFEARFPNEKE